ncbi:MAG TPA: VIT1/CCC1 transporter family protein [Candidatus Binatia bacterium]|jgi:VIT1/CCC1 family predicted Fe2+/Mn2+ transporter|nr:VIT1/CCC1 transporter family protein [Candidatus Binatia bacterium]
MALGAIEQRKAVIESRARIREFVFGVQDGLISTVGLLAGIQGATESNAVVIITGLTAMFAGAISMAAGSYLSSSAEKEIFDKELREAEMLAEREPYLAAEGLLKALNQEGLPREQGYSVVKLLLRQQEVFLRTFQEKVFGLGSAEINRPLQAALVMAASFIVGALIPIAPYFVLKGTAALYFSIVLSALTLFGVGVFKGRLAGKSQLRSGMQFFAIAVSAALLGYLIGLVVQYFFPDISMPA